MMMSEFLKRIGRGLKVIGVIFLGFCVFVFIPLPAIIAEDTQDFSWLFLYIIHILTVSWIIGK